MKGRLALWLSKITPMDAFAMTVSLIGGVGAVGGVLLWGAGAYAKVTNDIDGLQKADLAIASSLTQERQDRKEELAEAKELLREVRDNQVKLMLALKVRPE